MPKPHLVIRVGLTGGIASGKSTVAARLAERGAFVVDLDRLSHEAIEPGGVAYDAVVSRFGDDVLNGDGTVDRRRLGARVFADPHARRDLESIIHPAVRAESNRRIAVAAAACTDPPLLAVVDAALLVETGAWRDFDALVVVACSPETQLSRLLARDDDLSEEDAKQRLASQLPVGRKVEVADHVIDSEQPLTDMLEAVDVLFERLRNTPSPRRAPSADR